MIVRNSRDIGSVIKDERRSQGLRQEELALAAGTGRRFIVDVESGKPTARVGHVLDVLAALGLRVDIHKQGGRGADVAT